VKKSLIAFIVVAFLAVAPSLSFAGFLPVGSSFTLDQLVAGQTLTVGDKLFDHFSYSKTGNMPVSSGITVQGIIDSAGNYGILLSGAFQDLFGGGASDALVKFNVTVLDAGKTIAAVNLFGNPTVTGSGIASVTETFLPLSGSMNISDSTTHTGHTSASHVISPGQTHLSIQKDILAFAATRGSTAGFTYIGQTFVQTPVPGSLVMLVGGALAMLPIYRSRRRRS
jgi:hypothetical protein